MKFFLWLPLLCALTLSACEWHVQGEEAVPDADWMLYDYVYAGDSPDPEGEPMYIKLNLYDDGSVDGETLGAIYAEFTGTLNEDTFLNLEMEYLDHRCEAVAYATFNGIFRPEELTGQLNVWSCDWWSYDYDGERIGGRL